MGQLSLPPTEADYPGMVGALLLVTVHAERVMPVSAGPQIVSLPLVTNHTHIHREGKGVEGPQALESSSHSSRALLPVLLGRVRFFGRAACDLVTRQAAGPPDMDFDGTYSLVPGGALLLEDALVLEEALVVELLLLLLPLLLLPWFSLERRVGRTVGRAGGAAGFAFGGNGAQKLSKAYNTFVFSSSLLPA